MSYCTERFTRLDYCQFLISSQINYTLTYFAEHAKKWSHDTINRYLKGEKITPRLVWEKGHSRLEPSKDGYVIFDDTVLDKNRSRLIRLRLIEAVRRQRQRQRGRRHSGYRSGNLHLRQSSTSTRTRARSGSLITASTIRTQTARARLTICARC